MGVPVHPAPRIAVPCSCLRLEHASSCSGLRVCALLLTASSQRFVPSATRLPPMPLELQGDSGGPVIWRSPAGPAGDLAVGVVSWGKGCASDTPGVYADVAAASQWIKNTIQVGRKSGAGRIGGCNAEHAAAVGRGRWWPEGVQLLPLPSCCRRCCCPAAYVVVALVPAQAGTFSRLMSTMLAVLLQWLLFEDAAGRIPGPGTK